MARLLLPRHAVVRASRRAALLLLALAGMSIAASPAGADSINLLRPGASRLSPSILFDSSTTVFGSDADVAAGLDRDCVAIDEDVRGSWSRFGRVEFRFGQFQWEWEPPTAPAIVYVICVDRQGHAPSGGGGGVGSLGGAMSLAAVLSWTDRNGVTANGPGLVAETIGEPTAPVANSGPPTLADPPITRLDPPSVDPPILDPQISRLLDPPILDPQISVFPAQASGGSPIAAFDAPISSPPVSLDPIDAPPVPEPASWLLLGSGLAAAWRAAKRRT